ncbi:hypothetical protein VTJ49DRAFT_5624 [Mycothermus thermophilus]|uniref:MYND-type domain-containing protein n=1 Tax=Humicola insolens TaxID=85995 RepID=A0ABR3V2U5_HUMIN
MDGLRRLPGMSRLSPFSLQRFYHQQLPLRPQMESPEQGGETAAAKAASVNAGASPVTLGPSTETNSTATAAAEVTLTADDDDKSAMSETHKANGTAIDKSDDAVEESSRVEVEEVTLPATADNKNLMSEAGEANGVDIAKSDDTIEEAAQTKVEEVASVNTDAGPVASAKSQPTTAAETQLPATPDKKSLMSETRETNGATIANLNDTVEDSAGAKIKEAAHTKIQEAGQADEANNAANAKSDNAVKGSARANIETTANKSPTSEASEVNGAPAANSNNSVNEAAGAKVEEAAHVNIKKASHANANEVAQVDEANGAVVAKSDDTTEEVAPVKVGEAAQPGQVQEKRGSTQVAAPVAADKSLMRETSEAESTDIGKFKNMVEEPVPDKVKGFVQVSLVEWNPDSVLYNSHYEAHVLPPVDYTKGEALGALAVDIDRNDHEGDVDTLCVSCNNPGEKKCEVCLTGYCSRECQLADWAIHRQICGQLAGDFADDKRPTPEHHRILFFPTFERNLEFRWAIRHKTDQGDWWLNNHTDLLKYSTMKGEQGIFQYKKQEVIDAAMVLPYRRIGRALTLVTYDADNYHGPSEEPDPRVVNRSLNALFGPGHVRLKFGPIIFFSEVTLPNEEPLQTRDVTARDLHTLVRYLERRDGLCLSIPSRFDDESIPALRINDIAPGINHAKGIPARFEKVHAPLRPSNGRPDYICAVPFLLGLRWYLRPANPAGAEPECTLWKDNNLKYISLVCEPREVIFLPDDHDDDEDKENRPIGNGVGSAAAALDALPPTDRIVCSYTYGPFKNSVLLLHGSSKGHVDWRHVMALNAYLDEAYVGKKGISREEFAKFWEEYKACKAAMGRAEWAEAPSPWQWEGKEFKDRVGVFNPSLVRLKVADAAQVVWFSIMRAVNGVRVQGWGDAVQK